MTKQVQVSSKFQAAFGKKAVAVKEAQKAENTMQTCAMPIGWEGQCVVVGAVADQGKDSKDEKTGVTTEGKAYIRLDFMVVGDDAYQGKKFNRIWFVYDDQKVTFEERLTWCLNALENMGMPRSLRENGSIEEMLGHFLKSDEVYSIKVEKNSSGYGDGKQIRVSRQAATVDNSSSMSPGAATVSTSVKTYNVGDKVTYIGANPWEVVAVNGDKLQLKSENSGQVREVSIAELS